MAITAAELMVKVGYDGDAVDQGMDRTSGKIGAGAVAIGSAVGNIAANIGSQLPGAVFAATTSMEDAMVGIGTLVGTTSGQFGDLEAGIKSMVQSSPDSPDELGAAAYTFLSSGVTDTTQVLQGLQDATDLAGAGLGDTAGATDLITSAMASFSKEGLDSTKAAETFFGTIASGKTTTADLAQGFGGIAPLAATAGVKFTDLMAATAAITATGASASEAYSGLKGVISNVIKPTADASKAAEELGINFSQAHLEAVGLPAFLEEVKVATGGNVETMARLFSGTESLNTALALTGGQSEAFANNLTNIGVAGEQLQERAAETDETVSARFGTMKNKVMVALGDLGQKVFPVLFDVIERLAPIVATVAGHVQSGFNAMRAAFQGYEVADSGFIGAMARIGEGARQVIEWFKANWPQIKDTIAQVMASVQQAITAAWPVIQQIFIGASTAIQALITTVWPIIQDIITRVITVIRDEILPSVIPAFQRLQEIIMAAVAIVQEHWPQISTIIQQVGDIIGSVMEIIFTVIGKYLALVNEIWSRYGDEIMSVVSFVFGVIVDVIGTVMTIVQGIINTVLALINGDWSLAWDTIKATFSTVWDTIKGLGDAAINGLKDLLQLGWDGIKSAVGSTWDWIIDQMKALPGRIGDAVSGLFDGVKNAFRDAVNWLIDKWNGLEFGMPEIDTHIPGVGKIGGWSVGTWPDIPRLAKGGTLNSDGMVMVGERGPEFLYLPRAATVDPLPPNRKQADQMGTRFVTLNVYMPPATDANHVVRVLKEYGDLNGSVPITVDYVVGPR